MTRIGIFFLLIPYLASMVASPVAAQAGLLVISPHQGDVLQGIVTIQGTSDISGFVSAELAFSYTGDNTGNWFLITASSQPVNLDVLATWDTSTITDGDYVLRLRIYLKHGITQDFLVPDLRVRNYTPIETPTPAPTPLQPTATLAPTLTVTPFSTPTPLPPNPAVLTPMDVSKSIVYGGAGAILFLILLGITIGLRRR